MDESQIAARVAQNVPQDNPVAAPAPATDTPEEQGGLLDYSVALNDVGTLTRIQDYFDVPRLDRYNEQTQKQLRDVYGWAADIAKSTDLDKVLPIIRALENELGLTFKPGKLPRLAKFVHLKKQSDVLQYQMGAIREPV